MKKRFNILDELKKNYFWDVDLKKLDPERFKRLIIERVFKLGEASEIMMIINYYGEDVIIDVLKNLNYIDHKTLNFASKFFNLPLQSFKCYKRKQLIPQYWD
ncbi:MAG: hypothetical protein U9N72_11360 [Bacteroidota bacterium]|nr:hypothetical protein [Bacteroidota bacterium]